MARIEEAKFNEIDFTHLKDKTMPKSWLCPHCNNRNTTGTYADDILFENFKYMEHCDYCGYVHCWHLELTESFKKKVIDYLLNNGK